MFDANFAPDCSLTHAMAIVSQAQEHCRLKSGQLDFLEVFQLPQPPCFYQEFVADVLGIPYL